MYVRPCFSMNFNIYLGDSVALVYGLLWVLNPKKTTGVINYLSRTFGAGNFRGGAKSRGGTCHPGPPWSQAPGYR